MIQRGNPYLGLHKQPILIVDNTDYSEYFRIDEMPNELTSGKNFFKIYGNDELLVKGSEILIEVLDSSGNPIYHEINKYRDPSGHRIISIFIYEDTLPGIASVTILGVAKYRPNGSPIPSGWKDRHNVKWKTVVSVQPSKPNNSRIVFEKVPAVKIEEVNRAYMYYDFKIGDKAFQSLSQGTISNYNVDRAYSIGWGNTSTADITFADHIPEDSGGGFNPNMREIILQVNGLTTDHFNAYAVEKYGSSAEITYLDPIRWAKKDVPSAGRYGHIRPLYDQSGAWPSWAPTVLSVENSNTLKIAPLIVPIKVTTTGGTRFEEMTPNFLVDYPAHTNFTLSYHQAGTDTEGKQNIQSFARMTMKNIDPVAGDVYKIKTYMKSQGFGPYTLIGEEEVEDNNLLNDVNASTPYKGCLLYTSPSPRD